MNGYGFEHNGTVYTPDCIVVTSDSDARNHQIEADEIARLKAGTDDKLFLYVKLHVTAHGSDAWHITTWLGTVVSERCTIGRSVNVGGIAGRWSTKRSVDCRIFGVRYTGWYYESAGEYCRLKKAKRQ